MDVEHPQPTATANPFAPFRDLLARDIVATIRAQGLEEDVRRELSRPTGPKAIGEVLAGLKRDQGRPPLARSAPSGFGLVDPGQPGFIYEIDNKGLASARTAFELVRDLGAKSWVSKQTLIDLANAAIAALREGSTVP